MFGIPVEESIEGLARCDLMRSGAFLAVRREVPRFIIRSRERAVNDGVASSSSIAHIISDGRGLLFMR